MPVLGQIVRHEELLREYEAICADVLHGFSRARLEKYALWMLMLVARAYSNERLYKMIKGGASFLVEFDGGQEGGSGHVKDC